MKNQIQQTQKKHSEMRIYLKNEGTKPISITITDNIKIELISEFLIEKSIIG